MSVVIDVITLATLANLAFKSALTFVIGGWRTVGLGMAAAWAIMGGFSA